MSASLDTLPAALFITKQSLDGAKCDQQRRYIQYELTIHSMDLDSQENRFTIGLTMFNSGFEELSGYSIGQRVKSAILKALRTL